jgi:hypothetical protein
MYFTNPKKLSLNFARYNLDLDNLSDAPTSGGRFGRWAGRSTIVAGRLMVKTFAGLLRWSSASSSEDFHVDSFSPHDRELLRAAAERARQRLQAAGLLDIERDAQREIRARIEAA